MTTNTKRTTTSTTKSIIISSIFGRYLRSCFSGRINGTIVGHPTSQFPKTWLTQLWIYQRNKYFCSRYHEKCANFGITAFKFLYFRYKKYFVALNQCGELGILIACKERYIYFYAAICLLLCAYLISQQKRRHVSVYRDELFLKIGFPVPNFTTDSKRLFWFGWLGNRTPIRQKYMYYKFKKK